MEKQKVIEWMLANLPAFPDHVGHIVSLPFVNGLGFIPRCLTGLLGLSRVGIKTGEVI